MSMSSGAPQLSQCLGPQTSEAESQVLHVGGPQAHCVRRKTREIYLNSAPLEVSVMSQAKPLWHLLNPSPLQRITPGVAALGGLNVSPIKTVELQVSQNVVLFGVGSWQI